MRNINDLKHKFSWRVPILLVFLGLAAAAVLLYQIPDIQSRLNWRLEIFSTYLNGIVNPVKPLPTAAAFNSPGSSPEPSPTPIQKATGLPTSTPTPTVTPLPPTPTPVLSPTPTLTPTPIPAKVMLPNPEYEKQDINNCGPASLTHYLRFYGWKGNQKDIVAVIKPNPDDRNVNVEELVYFARTHAGWLKTEYRVGGSPALLKKFIAAGVPVMIEEGAHNETSFFPNDDLWSGHYLFVNGYDDSWNTFMTQDSWLGPNKQVLYTDLDKNWQGFNRVYILIYPPDKESTVKSILGADWDPKTNRQNALEQARAETVADPKNGFAWFNLGSNQTYFEDYVNAAKSFDQARKLNLPVRMLRYQFSPFIAYFHSGRTDELMTLVDYALQITFNSEEAMLWKGWGLYRQGKKAEAIEAFNGALKVHAGYEDAQYALTFVQSH